MTFIVNFYRISMSIVFFLIGLCAVFAQEGEVCNYEHTEKGYIVTENSDTLYGIISISPASWRSQLLFMQLATGIPQIYSSAKLSKYHMGSRSFVSISDAFMEQLYKGNALALFKIIEPVKNPAQTASIGKTVTLAGPDIYKAFYFYSKRGITKKVTSLETIKDLVESLNWNAPLQKEVRNQQWEHLNNDTTLIDLFRRYDAAGGEQ